MQRKVAPIPLQDLSNVHNTQVSERSFPTSFVTYLLFLHISWWKVIVAIFFFFNLVLQEICLQRIKLKADWSIHGWQEWVVLEKYLKPGTCFAESLQ